LFKNRPETVAAFRECGLRCTSQRYAVLDYLKRNPVHATAGQIYRGLNRSDPRASRATVYKTCIPSSPSAWFGKCVWRANLCGSMPTPCGTITLFASTANRVEDISWFDVPSLARRSQLGTRTVRDHEIVFRGICEVCSSE